MSDLILVNESGKIVAGKQAPLNKAAFAIIHTSIHKARPDVVAAAHSHTIFGKTWASSGKLLDPLTQDACIFYEDHGLFNDYNVVLGELSEGDRIAEAFEDKKAVILQNHGLLTVGHIIEECVFWFTTMECSCQSQLLAEETGNDLIKIDPKITQMTRDYEVGFPLAGYFSAQLLFQDIFHEQADLVDISLPEEKLILN